MDPDQPRTGEVIQDRADDDRPWGLGPSARARERDQGARPVRPSGLAVAVRGNRSRPRGPRDGAPVTDLVGFSNWALGAGDAAVLELLREVGTTVEDVITSRDGRIVKRLGDGLMATFLSAQAAVDAALDAQDAVRGIDVEGYSPRVRAGVHWGRPRKLGGDYLGVDVNVAARVVSAAKADQVLVSGVVLAQIDGDGVRTGRSKRLRADGTPSDLRVLRVTRV